MTYKELLDSARECMQPHCLACGECNGRACGNRLPGPGSKGTGDGAARNYDAWHEIRVNMDTIHAGFEPDTKFGFFGQEMKYPVFAGPVGAVNMHYGDKYNDMQYNDILVKACADAGIAAFTGDGMLPEVVEAASAAISACGGRGIPTVKPWDMNTLRGKFDLVERSGCSVVAMDIDAAGLPFLQNMDPPAGAKSVEELAEVIKMAGKPFIVKGIMTVAGAVKAKEAGAAGIIVSNHGGRVLDQCPATAEVLPEIAEAVDGMMILVDGGIRSGVDVFKALALGADAVVIARPYVTAVYGGAEEGVKLYTEKIGAELIDTMKMCGAASLADISSSMVRW
ncbi:MAG: alpha-hydroxy-acid oxidizing protein [Lachnospiraceae bacterium]|nr:alpha-hydroxy-acid oxidizing protein [Lachnospiraceae bacterium]